MLWIVHRNHHGKPPLKVLTDFVIIDEELHKEFDSFKTSVVPKGTSFFEVNELLSLYCSKSSTKFSIISKFGYIYVKLSGAEVDSLIDSMHNMNLQYRTKGEQFLADQIKLVLQTKKG